MKQHQPKFILSAITYVIAIMGLAFSTQVLAASSQITDTSKSFLSKEEMVQVVKGQHYKPLNKILAKGQRYKPLDKIYRAC